MDSLNLNDLREEITKRLLDEWGPKPASPVPSHNAGSGIVVDWDPRDRLPDIETIEEISSEVDKDLVNYKAWVARLVREWCVKGLDKATEAELNANINGTGTVQWWRFCKQINLSAQGKIGSELYRHAWELFQEQCFDRLVGWEETHK